ncbi:MAG: NitT/TauT family transport system permease protein [Bradyrhizobium sp.]|jgi:NitT/TauT family transport system permease protein|nr:NitT/TauT family transport system permease protein [Bradyrhizobium sp.]
MSMAHTNSTRAPGSQLAQRPQDNQVRTRRLAAFLSILYLYANRLLILGAFAAVWWAAIEFGWLDRFFFSSPVDIARFLKAQFVDEILPHSVETLFAMLIAFALSGVAGVAAGLVLFELPRLKRTIDPFLTALNSMPRIALAPIFILWFGIGIASKVALAFSLGFFIVLISTYGGIRNVDPTLIRLSRSLGCTARQQFMKIMLPWAIPSVFAGLKLALIYSFLGVVTSEMLASKVGLGQLIMYYSGILRMDAVLGILFVMAVFAVLLTFVADWIEAALLGGWAETNNNKTL